MRCGEETRFFFTDRMSFSEKKTRGSWHKVAVRGRNPGFFHGRGAFPGEEKPGFLAHFSDKVCYLKTCMTDREILQNGKSSELSDLLTVSITQASYTGIFTSPFFSSKRLIFPVAVFGSSSTNSIHLGYL